VQCFVNSVMAEIGVRRPSLFKDPRLAFFMPLWTPLVPTSVPDLVCLIVYKKPMDSAVTMYKRALPIAHACCAACNSSSLEG
jgi:hypothetical protein